MNTSNKNPRDLNLARQLIVHKFDKIFSGPFFNDYFILYMLFTEIKLVSL